MIIKKKQTFGKYEKTIVVIMFIFMVASFNASFGQKMHHVAKPRATIKFINRDLSSFDLSPSVFDQAEPITVNKYWSAKPAASGRHFTARMLWSDEALWIFFDGNQTDPLVVSDKPDVRQKTIGLWDRDVCEIFLAPDPKKPKRYFEFEAAPTGEWVDVAIDLTTGKRIADFEYSSCMTVAAAVSKNDKIRLIIKIPWTAFGRTPKAGDVWLGNLFRCVGKDPHRGYLAWSPTLTKKPNFHVPEKFGEFEFVR
ncbi:MAG: carbohydrate-binding family 9-like protein [Pyrinomonadaceae bacterium]